MTKRAQRMGLQKLKYSAIGSYTTCEVVYDKSKMHIVSTRATTKNIF